MKRLHTEKTRPIGAGVARSLLAMTLASLWLTACGSSGGNSNSISLTGVAATGAAIAGGNYVVKCVAGTTSGTTAADGSYKAVVDNGSFPCLVEVSTASAKLHSLALSGNNGSAVANVTPLTEAVIGQLSADTASYFAAFDGTASTDLTAARLAAAQATVLTTLQAQGVAVPSSVSDLLSGALVAKTATQAGNDYDKLLDAEGANPVPVKLIALNDFHGNFQPTAASNGGQVVLPDAAHPAGTAGIVGGAAYLATLVKNLKAANANNVVVGAGDLISASPFASSITHDEASVDILNQIGMEVTSVGNHEFDRGMTELLRIQNGGCYPASGSQGVVGQDTCLVNGAYPGAKFKYLTANVTNTTTGKTLFPATYIKRFGAVSVGFIGLTFQATPSAVTASGVANLRFDEESAVINQYAANLKQAGVTAVVVLIHQGGQTTAGTINDKTCPGFSGDLLPILDKLSANVDVIVSGHTHQEYVCNYKGAASGKTYLVTQTGYYGGAVSDINLTLQRNKGVTALSANTVPVLRAPDAKNPTQNASLPAGFTAVVADPTVDALVTKYTNLSNTLSQQPVGSITASLNRALLSGASTPTRDETAEGAMGDVMADTYLNGVAGAADIAFVNPGSVRADLPCSSTPPCPVTYSALNTVEPFGNTLVTLNLTGAQIVRLLEQQWEAPNNTAKTNPTLNQVGRLLQVSKGFSYSYDNARPAGASAGQGNRLVTGTLKLNGVLIDPAKTYRIVTNNFLAGGGDNFTVMATGTQIVDSKILDLDAGIQYFKNSSPVSPPAPRVTRVN